MEDSNWNMDQYIIKADVNVNVNVNCNYHLKA